MGVANRYEVGASSSAVVNVGTESVEVGTDSVYKGAGPVCAETGIRRNRRSLKTLTNKLEMRE